MKVLDPTTELEISGPCVRREVFPLGETVWRDGKNLSHIFITRMLKEKSLLLLKQISEAYGEYKPF
jgi:hypothetical protein